MTVQITIDNKKLLSRLSVIQRKAPKVLDQLLSKAAYKTHSVCVIEIQQGQKSGLYYMRGGKTHKASAAGEYPATDTGQLVRNITVEREGFSNYTVGSRKGAPHGFWLEFGTSRMDARPWLTPSHEIGKRELLKSAMRLKL